ncbi:MAG: hypothetical protein ACLRRH_07450 [Clostridium sp.]
MAKNIYNSKNDKDIKLQKLSEQELNNDLSSSYSQNEKAYLIANCTGNILVKDTNGFRFVSKEEIYYFDINKYKIVSDICIKNTYDKSYNTLSENETNEEIAYTKEEEEKINKNTNCTMLTNDKNLRDMSLSLMENISYFLFQTEEEINFFNNNKSSSSSGLGGYGLDLI